MYSVLSRSSRSSAEKDNPKYTDTEETLGIHPFQPICGFWVCDDRVRLALTNESTIRQPFDDVRPSMIAGRPLRFDS